MESFACVVATKFSGNIDLLSGDLLLTYFSIHK